MRKISATTLRRHASPRGLVRAALLSLVALGAVASGHATEPSASTASLADTVVGDWYVLIHFTDAAAEDPLQLDWDEAVWRIERVPGREDRLRWSIHTRVEFSHDRGRYEVIGKGRTARSLGAWMPDAAQRAEIARGLRFGDDGVLSKTLRRNADGGFSSTTRARTDSASMIGYAERWTIELEDLGPVFTRDARMGAARVEPAAGRTRMRALVGSGEGRGWLGEYERDEALRGDFRMTRMGAAGANRDP